MLRPQEVLRKQKSRNRSGKVETEVEVEVETEVETEHRKYVRGWLGIGLELKLSCCHAAT